MSTVDAPECVLARAKAIRNDLLKSDQQPPRTEVNVNGIPDEIKALDRWVCWTWKRTKSKWTKKPIQPNLAAASSTDAATWSSFESVVRAFDFNTSIAGIGFVLADPYAGVDLDSCYDPTTDEADPIIHAVTSRLDSYTEISPSNTGVKTLVKARKPEGRSQSTADSKYDVECYDSGRFFTITGNRWKDTPAEINFAGLELSWFHQTYVDPPKQRESGNLHDFDYTQHKANGFQTSSNDVDKAREALQHIPAGYADTYGDWIRVGMGAKCAGEELFDDWVEWSSKSVKFSGVEECSSKWKSFPKAPSSIGLGTLIHIAKESGWEPSWAKSSRGWSRLSSSGFRLV